VSGDDDVDQTNHCWTEHNMAGDDTIVGGDDDVVDLDKMLRVISVVKVRMTSSHKLWTTRHHCFQDARKNTINYTLY
jgi:hypothetical protein